MTVVGLPLVNCDNNNSHTTEYVFMKKSTRENLENCAIQVIDYDLNDDTFKVDIYTQADKTLIETATVDAGEFAVIVQHFDEPESFVGKFFNSY